MVTDWQPSFELSVEAFYRGNWAAGKVACESLLSREDLPPQVYEQGRRNQVFYAPRLTDLIPETVIRPLGFSVPEPWTRFNPSIAAGDTGFAAIVRSANYDVDHGRYFLHDSGGVIRTQNYLLSLDEDLRLRSSHRLDDRRARAAAYPSTVEGFEDCRLFRYRGSWWATATTREHSPTGICQMALFQIDHGGLGEPQILAGPDPGRHEKNWVPLLAGEGLFFIYSFRPTVVLRYSDGGKLNEISRARAPAIAGSFRGGSQAVPVGDEFLCIIHESVVFQDGGRVYPHRFLLLDGSFRITEISPQFFFLDRTVEFCAGLALRNGRLTASFGFEDRKAYLASMPLSDVLGTLMPVARSGSGGPPGSVYSVAAPQRARPAVRSSRRTGTPAFDAAADLTLVSCLFDLGRRERARHRGIDFLREHAELVLGMQLPMLLYVEPELVDWVSAFRRDRGLLQVTEIIPRIFEDLPLYRLAPSIASVPTFRNHGPTKDTPLYQILNWSKLDLIAESILANRFGTDYYAWIDLALGHVARAPHALPQPSERVSILQMRAVSATEIDDRRRFYEYERGCLAAGFFSGHRDLLLELRSAFLTELGEALALPIRTNEQMILSYLSVTRSDLFQPYYGDYPSILANQDGIRGDVPTVLGNIAHCRQQGLWAHASAICEALMESLISGRVALSEQQRAQLFDDYLIATRNAQPPDPLDRC